VKIKTEDNKIVITDFDEFDAYKIAEKIEKDGLWFYKKVAASIENEKVKETLGFLRTEEQKHLKFFEERLFALRERKEDPLEEDDLLDSMDFGIFEPYQNIEELESVLTEPKKALKLGLIIESKVIQFYESFKKHISCVATKTEIDSIIREEKKHKLLIEKALKNL